MKRFPLLAGLAALMLLGSGVANAQSKIFKCLINGKTVISDQPCQKPPDAAGESKPQTKSAPDKKSAPVPTTSFPAVQGRDDRK